MSEIRNGVRNKLLLKLSDLDFGSIYPSLERTSFKLHDRLIRPNVPIEHVYFPDSGQLSVVVGGHDAEPIEVGMLGRELMTDMVLFPGRDRTPLSIIVQVSGEGWRISAEKYASAERDLPSMHWLAVRFQQWMVIQASYAALSHGAYTIPERLARWLLMVHDRLDGDELPLVHEFLAMMLAVRRSGVTEAIHSLEGRGAIRATRAKITIINREILETMAGGSYGIVESEYKRLFEEPT